MRKFLLFILPGLLLAESHEVHHHTSIFVYWVNYLIFMIPVIYILKGKFSEGWNSRKNEIASQLEKGKQLVRDAEERLSLAKASNQSLPEKLKSMEEQLNKDLNFEINQMTTTAEDQCKSLDTQVTSVISVEKQSLMDSLKNNLAEKVVAKTKGKLLGLDLTKVNENYLASLLKNVRFLN